MFRRRKGRVDENETASVSATGSGRASQDSAERRDGGTTQGASSKKHPRPDIDQEAQDDLQDLLKDLHGDEGDAGEDDIQSLMKELKLMRDEHEHVELERQLKRQLSEGEELRREIMSLPDQSEELVMELGLASMAEAEVSAESIEGARTRMETLKRAAVQAKSAGQQELARQNLRKMKEAKAMWEQMVAMRREALTQEITAYKRKALEFKQAGQQEEARTALRHFKGLQAELDRMLAPLPNSRGDNTAAAVAPHTAPVGSEAATARSLAATTTETPAAADAHSSWNVEQLTNQVADFKSRAVAAKQAGRMEEARALLRQSKTLQAQLDALQKGGSVLTSQAARANPKNSEPLTPEQLLSEALSVMATTDMEDSQLEEDISEEDKRDPDLLIALAHLTRSVEGDDGHDGSTEERQLDLEARVQNLESLIAETKRSAVVHKRSGNIPAAKSQLAKARQLEEELAQLAGSMHTSEYLPETAGDSLPEPPSYDAQVACVGSALEDATRFLVKDMAAQEQIERVEIEGNLIEVTKEDMQDTELLSELADLMK